MRTITLEDQRAFEAWKKWIVGFSLKYEKEQIRSNNVRGWEGFKAEFSDYRSYERAQRYNRPTREERVEFLKKLEAHIKNKEPQIRQLAKDEWKRSMKCHQFSWLDLVPNVIRRRF